MQDLHWQSLIVLAAANLVSLHAPSDANGQETVTTSQSAKSIDWSDPYKVPVGSIEKLNHFIKNAPRKIRPRTVLEMRRMNQSLDKAAEAIFVSPEANLEQRLQAANLRVKILNRQQQLGMKQASQQLDGFLDTMKRDETPEVQALARFTSLDHQADRWRWLSAKERRSLITDLSAELEGKEIEVRDVALLIKLADAASDTPEATTVADTIEPVLDACESSDDPAVSSKQPWLVGLVRRLRLPGQPLEVEGQLLRGGEIDWHKYRGKYVLVCYWATWSRPSLAEMESVKAAFNAYHDQGFEVVGVSLDADRTNALKCVEEREIAWPTLCNPCKRPTRWNHPLACKYAIHTIPRTILVDDEGAVIHMNLRGKQLHKTLAQILRPGDRVAESTIAGSTSSDKTVSNDP